MTCIVTDSSDGCYAPDDVGFDIAAGTDLLVYGFVKPTSANTSVEVFGKPGHYSFSINSSGYMLASFNHSVDGAIQPTDSSTLTSNTWYFFCASYDYSAGQMALFRDTSRVALVSSISVSGGISESFSDNFIIGTVSGTAFTGKYCELYVSTDITGFEPSNTTITVPTSAFSTDANTVCAYHCNEGTGTTIDNAEGTAALDIDQFRTSPNTPTWDTSDSPFNSNTGAILMSASNNGGF